jgi:hypothetical protein
MTHQNWKIRSLVIMTALLFSIVPMLLAFSSGPLPRKTGSTRFGEHSCTECHGGTANSGNGSLDLTGVPAAYVPGQKYNVRVSLQQTGQKRWGFELATRTGDGAQAGQLEVGADGFTQIKTDGGVQFIEHTLAGTRAGTANGPVNFDFAWTAPATNVGEVFFSVAGNAANNNGVNDSGDSIYTKEESVNPQGAQAEPKITSISPNSGPVTGGTPVIITGSDFAAGSTVTIGGVAATNVVVVEDSRITATAPAIQNPGVVDVVVTSGGVTATLTGGFTYTSGSTVTPSSNALIIPFVIDTAQFRTNLGMSNLTSSNVDVSVEFVDASGTSLATKTFSVPAKGLNQVGNVVRNLLNAPSVADKQGYLILEPSVAGSIAAFATPIDNSTQDSSVIQGTRGKSTKVLLPTSTSVGLFKTTLTLINDSNVSNTVEIELHGSAGASQKTQTVTLAPSGSFSTDNIHAFLGVPSTFGPIELTSTGGNPKPIIAISRVYAALTTSDGKTGTASSFFVAEPAQ